MLLPNNTGGWFLQSLIILANHTDRSPNNTLEDYLHLPIGASTGKYTMLLFFLCRVEVHL